MNRRDALKLLAGLPLLGFLKPEGIRMGLGTPSYDEPLMTAPAPTTTQQLVEAEPNPVFMSNWVEPESFDKLAIWNGESWLMWNGQEWEEITPGPNGKREIILEIPEREFPQLF